MAERCRLQAGDTADFKSALPLPVTETQLGLGRGELKFVDETIHVIQRAADVAVMADLRGIRRRDGDRDAFLVDVQSEEVNAFAHGCLVPNWFSNGAEFFGAV